MTRKLNSSIINPKTTEAIAVSRSFRCIAISTTTMKPATRTKPRTSLASPRIVPPSIIPKTSAPKT
ncbi:MAG: hypothetical protein MUC80_00390 [Candidatus Thermoplasmatota archaeon]|nr:hypothetical protein [Candidatus Thermoplasmatota archaeon]